jgi:hypothetical protein
MVMSGLFWPWYSQVPRPKKNDPVPLTRVPELQPSVAAPHCPENCLAWTMLPFVETLEMPLQSPMT